MRLKIFLLITFFIYTVHADNNNNTTASAQIFDTFKDGLGKLTKKITDEFKSFKQHVKILFDREKRQNFDPALASHISGNNLNQNIGFRTGLQSSPNARVIDRVSTAALKVSQKITNRINVETIRQLPQSNNRKTSQNIAFERIAGLQAPQELCPFKKVVGCNLRSKYRTFDGSCNNLQNLWWGKSEIPYKRYLAADYNDGIQQPRMFSTATGRPLPNPRFISRNLCVDNKRSETLYSHILALFGQFTAHDITSVSISTDDQGSVVDCPCGSPDPSCFSIVIPEGDELMKSSCLKFTRSSAAFSTFDCRLGVREQLNIISSFIDGSQIYGIDVEKSQELRSKVGGELQSSAGVVKRPYMLKGIDGACRDTTVTVKCFVGGEGRANENLGLTSLQTLFLRAHNKIAQELAALNPRWNDELLFEETRRIVIAILQHITYGEYLPAIIGWNTATLFDIVPLDRDEYYTGYDETIDPSIANEFSSAAFRFGHTMIRNSFSRAGPKHKKIDQVGLDKILFRPVEAYNEKTGGIDGFLFGLLNDQAAKYDNSFADTLHNHLFEFKLQDGTPIAVDLAATNINRGRDHGIPSYNAYRERCGLKRALKFDDLIDTFNGTEISKLAQIYESPDDIDLYIGGLSERPSVGAAVGPVFGCLIASQFNDLKKGDRFFYESGPSPTSFSLTQLREIRKMTLSKLICDNTDMNEIQPFAFFMPLNSIKNARVSCESLPSMDLQAWASI